MTLANPDISAEELQHLEQLEAARLESEAVAEQIIVENDKIARHASEGPLKTLRPIFFDVETTVNATVSLSSMTLRQYLANAELETMSLCIGDDEPLMYFTDQIPGLHAKAKMIDNRVIEALRTLARDPTYVWVAHNAAFDIRVLRFKLGLPQPKNVWCTLEGSMGAWPELPGGYSLDNCSRRLGLPLRQRKFKINLKELSKLRGKIVSSGKPVPLDSLNEDFAAEIRKILRLRKTKLPTSIDLETCNEVLEIYNCQDVVSMREIYYRQVARIPAIEQETALRTHHQRQFYFHVDPERLNNLITTLDQNAQYAEREAREYVTDDQARNIFNRETDDGSLRSVRYQRLKTIINEIREDEAEFSSTSFKKISPLQLAKNPTAHGLLEQTTRAGKMISHKRRASVFKGIPFVDCELGYMRAHTGRFSSPSVGKGLNLHNIPKHDKAVAEPIRKCFRLPPDMCFVRADLANVEYRIEGMLTGCANVRKMFDQALGGNIFNDPYCLAWFAMTGMEIDKKSPIRQVAKSAVLGLGFCMSPIGYAKVLLTVIGSRKVTEHDLRNIIETNGWTTPPRAVLEKIQKNLGCSLTVATASYHIHRTFNLAHAEFSETANWLVRTMQLVANSPAGPRGRDYARSQIERAYAMSAAPNRDMIDLQIDDDPLPQYPCVRVKCGPWVPTVCWREPHERPTDFAGGASKYQLTILKASGYPKPFTRQLAIENITQAAARNAMCMGLDRLEQRFGLRNAIHVHDEVLLIVPRERQAVLHARDALLNVFGPGHDLPHDWAILVKPDEVTVTESMYEDEIDIAPITKGGNDRWGKIERNEADCLVALP